MKGIQEIFTPEAETRIRAAVDRAEGGTAGEIVPFVVGASDSYEGALWKGAALGAMLASLCAAGIWLVVEPWGAPLALWMTGPTVAGAALGYLVAGGVPPVRRALIGRDVAGRRARRRAAVAFLEEEVFRTRDRTGILLFLSLFERQLIVLGDEGINSKVTADEWNGIVTNAVAGIRAGRAVDALVGAIDECGRLLERRGVAIQPDDANELSDELRSRDR